MNIQSSLARARLGRALSASLVFCLGLSLAGLTLGCASSQTDAESAEGGTEGDANGGEETKKKKKGKKGKRGQESAEEEKIDPLEGAPVWVTKDCRDHFKDEPVICGVGSVSGVDSPSLARNTAMARGRTEISRYLSIEVKSIIRDYQATKGGKTEQEIEDESHQISEMTLSGSRMASYFQGKDGTYYALMVLELDAFKESVESSSTIDQALKEALINNANKAFSVRDSEVSRY